MAGIRSRPLKSGKYRGWFMDAAGKQRAFTGTHKKAETLQMARSIEDQHRKVRLGYIPPPMPADKAGVRPFGEVQDEYLAWGASQGGRRGRPWAKGHQRMRKTHLAWWGDKLGLRTLGDLHGCLARVEAALRDRQAEGKAGKTVWNYSEALFAFCGWCAKRHYLAENPLADLGRVDAAPTRKRRALTPDEIQALLARCAPRRRMLYRVALSSGLRANELRSLTVGDLDIDAGGLHLHGEWTKNRRDDFQKLSRALVRELAQTTIGKGAGAHLLSVPSHTARELDKDLKAARIPKRTPDGIMDFHALRTACINVALDEGAMPREMQAVARHASIDVTMKHYARPRADLLAELAEKLDPDAEYAHCMQRKAAGAEGAVISMDAVRRYTGVRMVEAAGIESDAAPRNSTAEPAQNPCKTGGFYDPARKTTAEPGHLPGAFPRSEYAHSMHAPDLQRVIDTWPRLSEAERRTILAVTRRARR